MTTDLAASMLPDVGSDLDADDEDAAGYEAMMSELPTIVSMSGLLDGDFDELNEIQNLLAPVSDDDDEGNAAAKAASAEAAEDAYIQAMVPNPIPTEDFATGMDISATVAALDENLGFPSTSLVTTTETTLPVADTASISLSVKAPTKRVHKRLAKGLVTPVGGSGHLPLTKKLKLDTSNLAQTPATLRTSLDGLSAPNPLLFGRPIRIPSQPILDLRGRTHTEPSSPTKVSLKPRSPLKPTRAPKALYPPIKILKNREPPKARIALNPLVPELITSYPVPACLASISNNRPPLCKLIFKGKVIPFAGSPESAVARVPAPPLKTKPASSIPATCNNQTNNSATASKKKGSNKKKKSSSKLKKKTGAVKAKKVATKPVLKSDSSKKSCTAGKPNPSKPAAASTKPAPPKVEELIVANPLANVPPAAPMKMPPPHKPKTMVATPAGAPRPPAAIVSSNSSAASEAPEDLGTTDTVKKSGNSRPLNSEEKAQACRDRNRQHARNTRLRKKAYVEELKHSLMELVEERDKELASVEEEKSKKEHLRISRKRSLQDFLQLRGHNEQDEAKWADLVKDSKAFRLTLPVTKFQTTVHKLTASDPEQVLLGVQDVMDDASHFAAFLQTLGMTKGGNEEIQDEKSPVYLQYHESDDTPLLLDGSTGILIWKATTCGAVSQGAKSELFLSGSVRATFCSETDKLVSATLMFDTGVIQAQLSRSPQV